MKRWKVRLGILLIFAAGICIGVAGTGLYIRHAVSSILEEGQPAVTRLITGKLTRELDLTAAQQVAVQNRIREAQFRLREVRQRFRPEANQILFATIEQIEAELSPEQRQKLERLYEKFRRRWAQHWRAVPPGGANPPPSP